MGVCLSNIFTVKHSSCWENSNIVVTVVPILLYMGSRSGSCCRLRCSSIHRDRLFLESPEVQAASMACLET